MNEELSQLYKALTDAAEGYKSAQRELQAAQNRDTTALNELNVAQTAFDAFLSKMKKEAPRQSNWKSSERVTVAEKG